MRIEQAVAESTHKGATVKVRDERAWTANLVPTIEARVTEVKATEVRGILARAIEVGPVVSWVLMAVSVPAKISMHVHASVPRVRGVETRVIVALGVT
jgi:hypothetical protein